MPLVGLVVGSNMLFLSHLLLLTTFVLSLHFHAGAVTVRAGDRPTSPKARDNRTAPFGVCLVAASLTIGASSPDSVVVVIVVVVGVVVIVVVQPQATTHTTQQRNSHDRNTDATQQQQ